MKHSYQLAKRILEMYHAKIKDAPDNGNAMPEILSMIADQSVLGMLYEIMEHKEKKESENVKFILSNEQEVALDFFREEIKNNRKATSSKLSRYLKVSPTLSGMIVKSLEENGFLERHPVSKEVTRVCEDNVPFGTEDKE